MDILPCKSGSLELNLVLVQKTVVLGGGGGEGASVFSTSLCNVRMLPMPQ